MGVVFQYLAVDERHHFGPVFEQYMSCLGGKLQSAFLIFHRYVTNFRFDGILYVCHKCTNKFESAKLRLFFRKNLIL